MSEGKEYLDVGILLEKVSGGNERYTSYFLKKPIIVMITHDKEGVHAVYMKGENEIARGGTVRTAEEAVDSLKYSMVSDFVRYEADAKSGFLSKYHTPRYRALCEIIEVKEPKKDVRDLIGVDMPDMALVTQEMLERNREMRERTGLRHLE